MNKINILEQRAAKSPSTSNPATPLMEVASKKLCCSYPRQCTLCATNESCTMRTGNTHWNKAGCITRIATECSVPAQTNSSKQSLALNPLAARFRLRKGGLQDALPFLKFIEEDHTVRKDRWRQDSNRPRIVHLTKLIPSVSRYCWRKSRDEDFLPGRRL